MKGKGKREVKLLKQALVLMPDLVDTHCGNSEGTPCNDGNPSYVCCYHRWIADVRLTVEHQPKKGKP